MMANEELVGMEQRKKSCTTHLSCIQLGARSTRFLFMTLDLSRVLSSAALLRESVALSVRSQKKRQRIERESIHTLSFSFEINMVYRSSSFPSSYRWI